LVDELQREVDGVSNELREHHLYGWEDLLMFSSL
jgi:hypothetical protein